MLDMEGRRLHGPDAKRYKQEKQRSCSVCLARCCIRMCTNAKEWFSGDIYKVPGVSSSCWKVVGGRSGNHHHVVQKQAEGETWRWVGDEDVPEHVMSMMRKHHGCKENSKGLIPLPDDYEPDDSHLIRKTSRPQYCQRCGECRTQFRRECFRCTEHVGKDCKHSCWDKSALVCTDCAEALCCKVI